MTGSINFSPYGVPARVVKLADNGKTVYFATNTGTAWATSDRVFDLESGDTVLIFENNIEKAPPEIWREDHLVGVVKIKNPDKTVVEQSGTNRLIPTVNDPKYAVGNTVEFTPLGGVIQVISNSPIRFLDNEGINDDDVEPFIQGADMGLDFEDFGGLPQVMRRARELIEVPLQHGDALKKIGAKAIKGVLFTGAPGTGKTMLARIIANKAGATFYQISGPEIVSKWYGQSEQLLRKIFEHADRQDRAIIFFDEIDSVATQRSEDAHEASRRIVAQLLTLMDGFSPKANVMVIATTNRPQDIDSALRRPGRFDWELEFPLPSESDRDAMLRASARKLTIEEPLPYSNIASRSDKWSAAELAAIWSEAALLAVTDRRKTIIAEDLIGGFERVNESKRRQRKNSTPDSEAK
ncbi:ATP-binding protein [Paractinoplanes brasiliensis]|uniref:Transitional endoplasmic reticulum ATPase n=1 Tax=Paractinoplanes brasiliensis TaxID=52695 RepID=A0A4R6JSU9_9ACTN|nr:AAA family ATPase [Actinoplanes brasiliensis]TDO39793.1 transitional endoplasmic reticulum ATPase [Actinoplanes brasiliensis]GID31410.1 ATPase AAA [Actinoplanes brasiliensis]